MGAKQLLRWCLLLLIAATPALAQDPAGPPAQQAPPGTGRMLHGPPDDSRHPLFGKITAIAKGTLELAKPDGSTATVKLTDRTEFRKDRQTAKLEDFKVGDLVLVRAEDSGGQGLTAVMIAGRTGGGPIGMVTGGPAGEIGKDFLAGEVKSVDAPQITILRTDNVTQTIELTEETSLRRGRESVTMADIQIGDHVLVRGALKNNVFVSKSVQVIPAEQWKLMQERGVVFGTKPTPDPKPNPPQP